MSHRPIQIGIPQALSRPDRENVCNGFPRLVAGQACCHSLLTVVNVKIQTNEIEMKFRRGRDGEIVRPG